MALDRLIPETNTNRPDWPRLVAQVINSHSRALNGLSGTVDVRTVTATGSITSNDYLVLVNATAGAVTLNLPAAASSAGRVLNIKLIDASGNGVTLDGSASETIDGATTLAWTTQYQAYTIACDGTGWNVI